MNVDERLVKHIVKQAKGPQELGDFIASELVRYEKIRSARLALHVKLQSSEAAYQLAVDQHVHGMRALAKTCAHPTADYHVDKSGGNDSHHSCDICGHQW